MEVCAKCKVKFANDPHYFELFTTKLEKVNAIDVRYYEHKQFTENRFVCSECKTKLDQWFDSE
jgi:hypothetical protein